MLFQVIPPKSGDFSVQGFMNALEALQLVDDVLSFELAAMENEVRMYVRSARPDHVVAALEAHYPHIRFETVSPSDDPLLAPASAGDVFRKVLWPGGNEMLPLAVDDAREQEPDSDPFVDMMGAMSAETPPGVRTVTQVFLSEQKPEFTDEMRAKAMTGVGSANERAAEALRSADRAESTGTQVASSTTGSEQNTQMLQLIVAGAMIVAGVILYRWLNPMWADGRRDEVIFYGVLALVGVLTVPISLAYLVYRLGWLKRKSTATFLNPDLVKQRIGRSLFRVEVQIFAMFPDGGTELAVAERVLRPVVASYSAFDNSLGSSFETGPLERLESLDPATDDLGFVGVRKNLLGRTRGGEGVLGTREAVALWHIPGEAVDAPGLVRAGSRRLPVPREMFVLENGRRDGAALVGVERYRDGGVRQLYFPDEVLRRHHLYVARTRMGKTTLMRHIARSLLRDIAAGLEDIVLVVVDPHSDLVTDILNGMPVGAAGDVRLIDLGDSERACGINLLDVQTFKQRDMTIPTIISIAKDTSSSNSWGDRMEAILEWSLIALYEANRHRNPDEQYTIFDTLEFLTDETRRQEIIREGRDLDVAQWWYTIYPTLVPHNDRSAIAPVLRKIGEYASVEAARRVLGQRRCTLDIEEAIQSGKVVLVDTARARSGPDVSAIIGASILNLLQDIIQKQSQVLPGERRRIVVIVDEMQTLLGVKFDDMLAELSKFDGTLILATQSLDRLNTMTENGRMREAILANVGCLVAFQVNASDAALLQHELRGDVLDEQDIMDLPPHNAYGRLTLRGGNAHFSMEVLPPLPGNKGIADLIRQGSDAYTRRTADVDAEHERFMEGRFKQYFVDPEDNTFDFGSGS